MGLLGNLGTSYRKGLVQFIVNDSTGQNTVIQLDASLKEIHGRKSAATKFPLENGLGISDHMIISPFSLELNGIITDSPIGTVQQLITEVGGSLAASLLPPIIPTVGSAAYSILSSQPNTDPTGQRNNPPHNSVVAYKTLLDLQSNSQPFDVLTSLYRYPSMWIEDISAPRDSGTGDSLIFTVQLSQLILVSPQSVNVKIFANPALSANQGDLGQQNTYLSKQFQAGYASEGGAVNAVNNGPIAGPSRE